MALNFSHRPMFPAHLPEENLVSPLRIGSGYRVEGIPNGDGFARPWHLGGEMEDYLDYGTDRADRRGSQELVRNDVVDLLPSDPFGMDISTTVSAITGWLEDLEGVDANWCRRDELDSSDGNYQLFAGFKCIWNNAMRFQECPVNNVGFDPYRYSNSMSGFGSCPEVDKEVGESSHHGVFESACDVDGILSFGNENACIFGQQNGGPQEVKPNCSDENEGSHPALYYALSYLGVRDLLVVEKVCKYLRTTVRGDSLLWRSIHIGQPMNEKITDDVLLQLTNRAQGKLQCLSLMECTRITDDCVKHVLQNNPNLTKLSVPGCTKLSIEGILNTLKDFKTTSPTQGVTHLRIAGSYGMTPTHFEELKLVLGTDDYVKQNTCKPHFYHRGNLYLSCEDDKAIDVEICPKCQNVRLVYDCPAEGCQGKGHGSAELCRACSLCIPRCVQCGCCINDSEYVETFCLENLCSDCWKQPVKGQDKITVHSKSPTLPESSGLSMHG